MNSSQPNLFLTIDDLFLEARSHRPFSSSSAQASIWDNNKPLSPTQNRILSFEGQVVRSISATSQVDQVGHSFFPPPTFTAAAAAAAAAIGTTRTIKSLVLPTDDSIQFPLHPKALSYFKGTRNNEPPDHIVWLTRLHDPPKGSGNTSADALSCQATIITNLKRKRKPEDDLLEVTTEKAKKELKKHHYPQAMEDVIEIMDTDDEMEMEMEMEEKEVNESAMKRRQQQQQSCENINNNKSRYNNNDVSMMSHSDSMPFGSSRSETMSKFAGLERQEQEVVPAAPSMRMVAVLLNDDDDFVQLGDLEQVGEVNSVSARKISFQSGNRVRITAAMMAPELVDEQTKTLSFLGVPKKTRIPIIPARQQQQQQQQQQQHTIISMQDVTTRPDVQWRKKGPSVAVEKQPYHSNKRSVGDTSINMDDDSTDLPKNNKKCKKIPPNFLQQKPLHEKDPLELLVRKRDNRNDLDKSQSNSTMSFSDLWSEAPITTTSQVPQPSPVSTPGNDDKNFITQHICRMTGISRALIKARCAECGEGYKNISCSLFQCHSHKWRLEIRMDCFVSDGSAEAQLDVRDGQEEIMWALLGLMRTSDTEILHANSTADAGAGNNTSRKDGNYAAQDMCEDSRRSSSPSSSASTILDPFQDVRNKVLRILARRGQFSFRSFTAPSISNNRKSEASTSHTSGGGYVETIDQDHSQRAKEEEKLWFDICTAFSRKRKSFLLHAIPNSANTLALSSSDGRDTQLRTSYIRMNKQTTIMSI
ncbi:hypothetical protein BGZ65_007843, partial [Modicella reniformis]